MNYIHLLREVKDNDSNVQYNWIEVVYKKDTFWDGSWEELC